jgi:hypothetical protein
MGARHYDARIGRFTSADLVVQFPGWSQAHNRYSYGFNNPQGWVDPTGLQAESSGAPPPEEEEPPVPAAQLCDAGSPCYPIDIVGTDSNPTSEGNPLAEFVFSTAPTSAYPTAEPAAPMVPPGPPGIRPPTTPEQFIDAILQEALNDYSPGCDSASASCPEPEFLLSSNVLNQTQQPQSPYERRQAEQIARQGGQTFGVEAIIPPLRVLGVLSVAARAPRLGAGATLGKLTPGEIQRIQNAANRSGVQIAVVGSRVNPNKALHAGSDYDFVIDANSAMRRSLARSLPGSRSIAEGIPGNQDIFKGAVDPNLPHVIFFPR